MSQIQHVMHVISILIGVVGVSVIVWGVFCGLLYLIRLEIDAFKGQSVTSRRVSLKEHLGFYLLLGLEFLVAADIIETLISPTLEHLLFLGGIITIRTVISLSLSWELSHKETQET
jgi:uncharacterized membrane protein